MTDSIFKPFNYGGLKFRNRIIRSATHEGMADESGRPDKKLKDLYLKIAKGGAGAIITGYAGVMQNGKSNLHNMMMINNDSFIKDYKVITNAVHEQKTPIYLQIAHCGKQTRRAISGEQPVAPSAIKDKFYTEEIPHELSEKEIEQIIENFINAIIRGKKAGFDGIQLHIAHGYLLAQFLSPYSNRRNDKWGGSTENRFRIVKEILENVKFSAGNFPVFAKINGYDGRKGGMNIKESIKVAKLLEGSGCNAIEVSCGIFEDGLYTMRGPQLPLKAIFNYNFKYKNHPGFVKKIVPPVLKKLIPVVKPIEKYNVEAAGRIKENVSIPVISVGGIHKYSDIRDIIGSGSADLVSMCRPFIIEPDIVNKFMHGREKSKCIKCNYCPIIGEEKPLKCYYGKLPE